MHAKYSLRLSALVLAAVTLSGCRSTQSGGNNTQVGVSTVTCQGDPTTEYSQDPTCLPQPLPQPVPGVILFGDETGNYIDPQGINETPQGTSLLGYFGEPTGSFATGSNGTGSVTGILAPALWNVEVVWPYNCGYGPDYQGIVYYEGSDWYEYLYQSELLPNFNVAPNNTTNGEIREFDCLQYGPLLPASTRFAILGGLPGTLTLGSATPLTTTYGMPMLYVYDGTGSVVATETATSVSSGGTEATFPFPSSLNQNGYSLALVNQTNYAPGYSAAGTNLLSIASSQTISGAPFGVAAGGLTDSYVSCSWWPGIGGRPPTEHCTAGSSYNAFPVVSLYSQNQVLINGTAVNVGANPTAVAAYPAASVTKTYDGGLLAYTYSGTTQAVVANSGANTVSVLDLVNDVVLSTITVGNQPVALAASSSGGTAYVANYADSTVTQVNLTTDTPTTTIAVGGKPTSITLTAAGILWVGGAGFLTEINTSNMGVVATESTSGRTIAALGFSDAENELIATSTNTSGSVYVDEINPSTVQAGGVYTPVASQSVSTLGTFFNPRIQAQSFGFTNTLTSSLIPVNTAQPGAPPLVVQDGWAAVTATPTGFTITDLSGNIVLVSETTPSPIAAIAVDTNLNVAYLTMPDSNTLLTVPLPGTGSN